MLKKAKNSDYLMEDDDVQFASHSRVANKARLDLNDLINRNKAQEKEDKKKNFLILSATGVVGVLVILILIFISS